MEGITDHWRSEQDKTSKLNIQEIDLKLLIKNKINKQMGMFFIFYMYHLSTLIFVNFLLNY